MDGQPRFDVRKRIHPLRLAVSALGLAVFNLFMLVPGIVYAALLFSLYACSLAFYAAGIVTTASGLAGTNDVVLDWPGHKAHGTPQQIIVRVGEEGIYVGGEEPLVVIGAGADRKLRITSNMDADSRRTHTLAGAALVLGGILLFLLSLVISRYSWLGLKRYARFNRALLTG